MSSFPPPSDPQQPPDAAGFPQQPPDAAGFPQPPASPPPASGPPPDAAAGAAPAPGYAPVPGAVPPPPPGYGAAPGYPPAPAAYPPGYGAVDPSAPFGRHPMTGEPYSDKSKLAAGLLELFLGGFGAGRWYLGNYGIAVAQLLTCGGLGIWALIDAIMMLTGNVRDKYGRVLRD